MLDVKGLVRIGQGRGAEIFALEDGERVVKLAREGADLLEREATALRAAHGAGVPVPEVYELVEDRSGRRGLVMGRVLGRDMLTRFAARPWTLFGAGRKLGALHAQLHRIEAPRELPAARAVLEERIGRSTALSSTQRDRALAVLWQLPDGDRLCHFDFHPANVISDGRTLTIIDWPGACRGDPLADVAMTAIALHGGTPTPGTPLITRLFAPLGRKVVLGGYMRAYRRHGAWDRERFGRWRMVAAALRLTYEIAGEESGLARIIDGR
jgi:aminoglycoside phosphotransferase (APT) family kinase protein